MHNILTTPSGTCMQCMHCAKLECIDILKNVNIWLQLSSVYTAIEFSIASVTNNNYYDEIQKRIILDIIGYM